MANDVHFFFCETSFNCLRRHNRLVLFFHRSKKTQSLYMPEHKYKPYKVQVWSPNENVRRMKLINHFVFRCVYLPLSNCDVSVSTNMTSDNSRFIWSQFNVSASILDLPAENSIPSEGYRSTLSTGCPCCTVRTLDLLRVSYILTVWS